MLMFVNLNQRLFLVRPRPIDYVSLTEIHDNLFKRVLSSTTGTSPSETLVECSSNNTFPSSMSLGSDKLMYDNEWNVNLFINNKKIKFRIGSVAQEDILHLKIFNRLTSKVK